MSEQPKYSNLQILWIEEQVGEYYLIEKKLRRLFNLDIAENEIDGERHLKGKSYDLVLLDLMLPADEGERELGLIHLDAGRRILQKLREPEDAERWSTPSNCKVLVFTARGVEEALAEIESLIGQNGELIQKPVQTDEFIKKVCALLLGDKE
jgi:CheY-like chemotaxis protein